MSADIRLRMVWALFLPVNRRLPVSTLHRTTPAANTSARQSSCSPMACSGAMYENLPLTVPGAVWVMRVAALATPKSMTRVIPSVPMRMLPGETSRWTRPSDWP